MMYVNNKKIFLYFHYFCPLPHRPQKSKMASAAKEIPDAVKRNIRAVLLSKIGGVPLDKFGKDYRELLGQPFPFRDLGYPTLKQCLASIQDAVR